AWNNLRGVPQGLAWSGPRDVNGYATGEGTLTWQRLGKCVNSYTGRMVHGRFDGPVIREQGEARWQTTSVNGDRAGDWPAPEPTPLRSLMPPAAETAPRPGPSPASPIVQSASPAASPPRVDPTQKHRMIEELKKQTESVLAQVRDATGNFREIDRLEAVQNLPGPVSASVTVLAARAADFRMKVGYEVAAYECLAEIEAVEALALVDEITRD